MSAPLSREVAQEALDALTRAAGNRTEAGRALGVHPATMQGRLLRAKQLKLKPSADALHTNDPVGLRAQIKTLQKKLADSQADKLDEAAIKRRIIGLAHDVADAETPAWVQKDRTATGAPGVPILFVSDLHWGEVVHPSQINGVNRYNLELAHRRIDLLAEGAVRLLDILSPARQYPGIVICLGGDMVSGNIHDELTATNEINTMPTVVDLYGKLRSFIEGMADIFGRVFVPCVTGNHGRDTTKIWGKDRHHTSFDWLLYVFLAKHFEHDKRVTFLIPDGPDAHFKVYNTRYLLTHGDQFRGGDGMIGALGPIMRGDHKKRSRNAQIAMEYDVLLMGHWHQYIHLTRLIVNGSLKGYDEYAYSNNFPFEVPQQALWVTHPTNGITYRMPVLVDKERMKGKKETSWVSVAA